MTYHSFTVMAGVKLNTSQQELVLQQTFVLLFSLPDHEYIPILQFPWTCLCVCRSVREIVESLRVSVPLDPAEVLHYSLCCSGQTIWIHHHLVHTDTFILKTYWILYGKLSRKTWSKSVCLALQVRPCIPTATKSIDVYNKPYNHLVLV